MNMLELITGLYLIFALCDHVLVLWFLRDMHACLQAMAEEKFKLCVDAYNSLCKVVSPA